MTEAKWLKCTDPVQMLEFLQSRMNDRKPQLFACACCRRIWHLITDETCRETVEIVERNLEGQATDEERNAARHAAERAGFARSVIVSGSAMDVAHRAAERAAWEASAWDVWDAAFATSGEAARSAVFAAAGELRFRGKRVRGKREREAIVLNEVVMQSALLRCIFGNPFRPTTVDRNWLTTTVLALAQGIYDDRAFDRLPILADALQDAGCDNEAMLAHCRGPGPHARGCWVVDLVLGKA